MYFHFKIESNKVGRSGRVVFACLNWVLFKQQAPHRVENEVEAMSSTETQTSQLHDGMIRRRAETKQMNN